MAIVTTSSYKTWKGISGTTYDAQLDVMVAQAIDDFEQYTGRSTVASTTITEKHNGHYQPQIQLRTYPVTSLSSVTFTRPDGASLSVPTTSFAIDLANGVLKFDPTSDYSSPGWYEGTGWSIWGDTNQNQSVWARVPVFPKGHQNISVVYVGGYTTYPAGMQGAIYNYIDYIIGNTLVPVAQMGYKSKTLGNHTWATADGPTSKGESVDEVLQRLFFRYRRLGGDQ